MIIGERFVWGHLGKTGGDATYALFTEVTPDLVVEADAPHERSKHKPFRVTDPSILADRITALNLRRLPGWQLSVAQHRSRHGTAADPTPRPLAPPDELAGSSEGDETLEHFLGDVTVDRWLRMEHLREDFLAFVSSLRPLTDDEVQRAVELTPSKSAAPYRRDVFTAAQMRRLYERNPRWAALERELYGDLLGEDQRWWERLWSRRVAIPGP